jgi:hypothetical protein
MLRAYKDSFGKLPTVSELAHWTVEFKKGSMTQAGLTSLLTKSLVEATESDVRQLVSLAHFSGRGTAPVESEILFWTPKIRQGTTGFIEIQRATVKALAGIENNLTKKRDLVKSAFLEVRGSSAIVEASVDNYFALAKANGYERLVKMLVQENKIASEANIDLVINRAFKTTKNRNATREELIEWRPKVRQGLANYSSLLNAI